MKKVALVFLVFASICSCSLEKENKTNIQEPLSLFENSKTLEGEVVELDKDLIGFPAYRITQMDSLLVMYDYRKAGEKFLFVVDINEKKLIKKILNVGWAPCEFSLLLGLKTDNEKKNIHFMEPNKRQFFNLSFNDLWLDSIQNPCPELITTFLDENGEKTSFADVLKTNDGYYLGLGPDTKQSMFSVLDPSGKVVKNLFDFPDLGVDVSEQDMNYYASYIYNGQINKQPSGSKIAYVLQPGLLGIADMKDDSLKIINQFETIKPLVEIRGRRAVKKKEAKMGYVLSYVTQKYIFVGLCGKTLQETATTGEGASSEHILVFDWEGNPIVSYALNYPVMGFTVDEKNEIVYAVSNIPEPKIIKYTLDL